MTHSYFGLLAAPTNYSYIVAFRFLDLFAGIGGFHAALTALGGECVDAVEIDQFSSTIYQRNWGLNPFGDVTEMANEDEVTVPDHEVLVAGFPCQPFSKSGAQKGMEETRGTLFWNILKIVQAKRPALVMLENVRNLAGPRHLHEWDVIIRSLREEGYEVCETPNVLSPHQLPREFGGRPQVRERVFIVALRNDKGIESQFSSTRIIDKMEIPDWNPQNWNLQTDLPLDVDEFPKGTALSKSETLWIDAWNDFVEGMWEIRDGNRLPGFPIWADEWRLPEDLEIPANTPAWKSDFLRKNAQFYADHQEFLDGWTKKWDVYSEKFPPSRRKLEWQAQDTPRLWDTVMHFRPSGIRAKRPTYLPALVAITQTSIIGPLKRRISTREASRLQGLPDWFSFGEQADALSYKQLGNGVSVGAIWFVLKRVAEIEDGLLQESCASLYNDLSSSPTNPDERLEALRELVH